SIWPVVAMLAVLRAGGACVNIDPSLPPGRIHEILQERQSTILVASHAKKQLVQDSAPFAVTIITVPLIIGPSTHITELTKRVFTAPTVRPHDAAFVIFSSGSTGKPKAIVMEHINLSTSISEHSSKLN